MLTLIRQSVTCFNHFDTSKGVVRHKGQRVKIGQDYVSPDFVMLAVKRMAQYILFF